MSDNGPDDAKLRESILDGVRTEQERQAVVRRLMVAFGDSARVLRATWARDIAALEEVARISRERLGGSEVINDPWRQGAWVRLEREIRLFLDLLRVQHELVDRKLGRPSGPGDRSR